MTDTPKIDPWMEAFAEKIARSVTTMIEGNNMVVDKAEERRNIKSIEEELARHVKPVMDAKDALLLNACKDAADTDTFIRDTLRPLLGEDVVDGDAWGCLLLRTWW